MEEEKKHKVEGEVSQGWSFVGFVFLSVVIVATFMVGFKWGQDSIQNVPARTCECKAAPCPAAVCPQCPPQFLVMDEDALKPILPNRCRCKAWTVGADSDPECRIMKDYETADPGESTCEE